MNSTLKTWKIETLSTTGNEKLDSLLTQYAYLSEPGITFLLDTTKQSSMVEKIIFEIYEFHMKRLNIDLIKKDIHVEFWFRVSTDNLNDYHLDKDEFSEILDDGNKSIHVPFLSCVTYLNDNDRIPTIITDVDKDMFDNKNFSNTKCLYLSLPRKMKHISFEGSKYYHGKSSLYDTNLPDEKRNILVMNFWEKKPLNVPLYNEEYFSLKYAFRHRQQMKTIDIKEQFIYFKEESVSTINVPEDILSPLFFIKSLYGETGNCHQLNDIIKYNVDKGDNNTTFRFVKDQTSSGTLTANKKIDVKNMKKFDQRVVINNTFSSDVCKWIINEYEEYASRERRIDAHIQVELMPSVLKFALISFQNTFVKEISKYYSICLCKTKYNFEITDLLIVKYEKEADNLTKSTTYEDKSCLTIKVFLSDQKDFEGGELHFNDDISYGLSQGDAMIFSGSTTHTDIKISKGSLYILVFSIDISEITSSVQD